MTETEQLADIIAISIHAATEPLRLEMAALKAAPAYATKAAWDVLEQTVSDLRSRLAAWEQRPPVEPPLDGKTDIAILQATAPMFERLASLEARAPIPGPSGPQGERGEPGLKGADGLIGPKGDQGDQGEVGPRGLMGEKGDRGAEGTIGPIGPMGQKGEHGDQGLMGLQGSIGPMGEQGDPGERGSDGLMGPIGDSGPQGERGEAGLHGKDADPDLIAKMVDARVAALPPPKDGIDGKSLTLDDVRPLIDAAVAAMPPPKNGLDGKSVTVEELRPVIESEVAKIPPPKDGAHGQDGRSVTIEDVAPLVQSLVEKAFATVPLPNDGLGIKSAVVDRAGRLIFTMTDDSEKDLGSIVGKDGLPGVPGRIGDRGEDGRDGIDGKHGSPGNSGKDGINGINGKDGLGFDDLDVVFDDAKGWLLRFVKGAQRKDYPIPVPFDAGLWEAGRIYPKGAGVTVKGAFWIAQAPTNARPGEDAPASRAWRLSVKGGRDGKPGKDGKDGSDA